jgi:hypothetical protein
MKNIPLALGSLTLLSFIGVAPATAPTATCDAEPSALSSQRGGDDEEEVPDKRDDIKELCKKFEGHIKKKGKEDVDAIPVLDKLLQEFPGCGPKDRALIVKTLGKGFGLSRKENRDGTRENRVPIAAAVCLSKMAPESVKTLIKLCNDKKVQDDSDVRRRVILSLGKTEDESGVDTLLKLISAKEPKIQGAAIEALGQFGDVDQKVRKLVCEKLIKLILPIKSTVDSDADDQVTREQYDVIGPPTITTLQKLTGQNIRNFAEWNKWWNKNKRKDWDEEQD